VPGSLPAPACLPATVSGFCSCLPLDSGSGSSGFWMDLLGFPGSGGPTGFSLDFSTCLRFVRSFHRSFYHHHSFAVLPFLISTTTCHSKCSPPILPFVLPPGHILVYLSVLVLLPPATPADFLGPCLPPPRFYLGSLGLLPHLHRSCLPATCTWISGFLDSSAFLGSTCLDSPGFCLPGFLLEFTCTCLPGFCLHLYHALTPGSFTFHHLPPAYLLPAMPAPADFWIYCWVWSSGSWILPALCHCGFYLPAACLPACLPAWVLDFILLVHYLRLPPPQISWVLPWDPACHLPGSPATMGSTLLPAWRDTACHLLPPAPGCLPAWFLPAYCCTCLPACTCLGSAAWILGSPACLPGFCLPAWVPFLCHSGHWVPGSPAPPPFTSLGHLGCLGVLLGGPPGILPTFTTAGSWVPFLDFSFTWSRSWVSLPPGSGSWGAGPSSLPAVLPGFCTYHWVVLGLPGSALPFCLPGSCTCYLSVLLTPPATAWFLPAGSATTSACLHLVPACWVHLLDATWVLPPCHLGLCLDLCLGSPAAATCCCLPQVHLGSPLCCLPACLDTGFSPALDTCLFSACLPPAARHHHCHHHCTVPATAWVCLHWVPAWVCLPANLGHLPPSCTWVWVHCHLLGASPGFSWVTCGFTTACLPPAFTCLGHLVYRSG